MKFVIGEEVGEADWSKEKLAHYLEAPGSKGGEKAKPEDANSETPILDKYGEDLRYGLYEQKLIGQGTSPISPIVKARTIVDHLSKTSVYTRAPEHKLPTNGDPVAPYLFSEKKRGYCVHFAHAAVYLLRLAGIPSRIGTGYLTDLSYAKDGHVLLHIGDRHAWPEIYVRGQGWLPIDIQPAEAENEQEIIPDEKLLEELMSKIDPAELLAGTPPTAPEDLEQPRLIERIVSGRVALGALMATLSLLLIAKCWLRYAWLFPARVELRTQRAYRSFASYVADLGLLRNIGETRQEFAKRVQSIFEIKATALTNLNEARVYSTRFDNKSMLELLRAIEEVQDSPTNGKQRIRRILGFFNPLSLTRLGRW